MIGSSRVSYDPEAFSPNHVRGPTRRSNATAYVGVDTAPKSDNDSPLANTPAPTFQLARAFAAGGGADGCGRATGSNGGDATGASDCGTTTHADGGGAAGATGAAPGEAGVSLGDGGGCPGACAADDDEAKVSKTAYPATATARNSMLATLTGFLR